MPPSSSKRAARDVRHAAQAAAEAGDDEVLLGQRARRPRRRPARSPPRPARRSRLDRGRGGAPAGPRASASETRGSKPVVRGQHLPAAHVADLLGDEPAEAHHLGGGHRERAPGGLHEQGPDEGDRQGHGQGEGRPRARDRFEPHRAVEGVHLALDHVEADAAAGDGGEGARRGEAGVEHEGQEVPVLRGLRQSPRARFLADPLPVEAAPVVGDRDLHLRALQGGGDRDGARRSACPRPRAPAAPRSRGPPRCGRGAGGDP